MGEAEIRARSLPARSPAAPIRTIATGHAAEGPAEGPPGVGTMQIVAQDITTAAGLAVDEVIKLSGRTVARCNVGVNLVFKMLSSYTKHLDGMRANDMVKHWRSHPDEWVRWNRAKKLSAWRTTDGSS